MFSKKEFAIVNSVSSPLKRNITDTELYECYPVFTYIIGKYNRTSVARTSLEPWKIIQDTGSSRHWGVIMAQSQEAKGDNLEKSFRSSIQ